MSELGWQAHRAQAVRIQCAPCAPPCTAVHYRGADGLARLAVSVAFEFLLAAEQDAEHVRHPVVPHVLSLEVLVAKDAIQCVEQLGVVGR